MNNGKIQCLILFIFQWIMIIACNAQNSKANYLVFKIDRTDRRFPDHSDGGYFLIRKDKLLNFKEFDSIQYYERIMYNIVLNGGVYLSEVIDLYAYGCCEYGSIDSAIQKYFNRELSEEQIKKYAKANKVHLSDFDSVPSIKILFDKWPLRYEINVWSADLEFCVCPIYMQNPPVKIYPYLGAHLIEIKSINKPSRKMRKKIKRILNRTIKIDFRSIKKEDGL